VTATSTTSPEGRTRLLEPEVLALLDELGIRPPRHCLVAAGERVTGAQLTGLPGDRVVLKVVSPDIVHKTEVGGVRFVEKERSAVARAVDELTSLEGDVAGVLMVEEIPRAAFGAELFVGIRHSREFGPVLAAGLGGTLTELLADRMRPGLAVARAVVRGLDPADFLELFRRTTAWELLSGQARGRDRLVRDDELLRLFAAFIDLAGRSGLAELEVNPFVFRDGIALPLDGRGRLGPVTVARPGRPAAKVDRLLEPRTVAVVGVSAKGMNFGRIIVRNLIECGFEPGALTVVKPGLDTIDGVRCVPTVADLGATDLLVVAAGGDQLPALLDAIVDSGQVGSAVLIPGGVGEREGTEGAAEAVRACVARARAQADGGPVFVGPNSLGMVSRPGRVDTFFIPSHHLDRRWHRPARPVALVSQSGAFIASRMSNLPTLDPAFAVSIGNQLDVTVSDLVAALGRRDDVDVVGVYAEGFDDLDGLELTRVVRDLTAAGTDVVFYKAGRSEQGRAAAAGHTAALAGDYDVCAAGMGQAGALVASTFDEWSELLELCAGLHGREACGPSVGLVTNAGYEAVGVADSLVGPLHALELASLAPSTRDALASALIAHRLNGLVNARNPVDLTPMADEAAFEATVQLLLDAAEVHALIVANVPLTARMLSDEDEIRRPGSMVERLPRLFASTAKPLVAVVDSGPIYEPLVLGLREAGIPVFRSADRATQALGRWMMRRR
jgi:acyl-CoA synthetase (NDP forming)